MRHSEDQEITFFDFLAGGGGVTHAASQIKGVKVKGVLNHSPVAIRTNLFHHKGVKHYHADIYTQDERDMEEVDVAWASVECTQFSKAKGGLDKNIGSYVLAWQLIRYFKQMNPYVIGIENVPEFKKWSPIRIRSNEINDVPGISSALLTDKEGGYIFEPNKNKIGKEFEKWKLRICSLGYEYHELICNAADYGIPTRRVRYFAYFVKKEISVSFPKPTHSEKGGNGKKKWLACKHHIKIQDEGQSIFGRKYNPNVAKNKRSPLVPNTLARIAGGIKKYAPELNFIFQYYGTGKNIQSTSSPLNAVVTKDRHVLVTMEKAQFVADHCHQSVYNHINEPMSPQLTWQDKRYVTAHGQFLNDYYGRHDTAHSLFGPANTITAENSKNIVSAKGKFIAHQNNSNGNPQANIQSIEEPLRPITTEPKQQFISLTNESDIVDKKIQKEIIEEKVQFITHYFSAGGNHKTQNQSAKKPLNAITTGVNKQALITALYNNEFDFDVKMRFLEPEELSKISSFPDKYFTDPRLKLTKKEQVRLIGNAVPPEWAKLILEPVIKEVKKFKEKSMLK